MENLAIGGVKQAQIPLPPLPPRTSAGAKKTTFSLGKRQETIGNHGNYANGGPKMCQSRQIY